MKDGNTIRLPQGYKEVAQVVVGNLTVIIKTDSNGVCADIFPTDEVALAGGAFSDEFIAQSNEGDITPLSTAYSFHH